MFEFPEGMVSSHGFNVLATEAIVLSHSLGPDIEFKLMSHGVQFSELWSTNL